MPKTNYSALLHSFMSNLPILNNIMEVMQSRELGQAPILVFGWHYHLTSINRWSDYICCRIKIVCLLLVDYQPSYSTAHTLKNCKNRVQIDRWIAKLNKICGMGPFYTLLQKQYCVYETLCLPNNIEYSSKHNKLCSHSPTYWIITYSLLLNHNLESILS